MACESRRTFCISAKTHLRQRGRSTQEDQKRIGIVIVFKKGIVGFGSRRQFASPQKSGGELQGVGGNADNSQIGGDRFRGIATCPLLLHGDAQSGGASKVKIQPGLKGEKGGEVNVSLRRNPRLRESRQITETIPIPKNGMQKGRSKGKNRKQKGKGELSHRFQAEFNDWTSRPAMSPGPSPIAFLEDTREKD